MEAKDRSSESKKEEEKEIVQGISLNNTKLGVLSIGGAFNPIHTQHIEMMNLAKEYLEREFGYEIVAGFLAAAPDGYVKDKLKSEGMKGVHRLAMVNIAIQNSTWLKPCGKLFGSDQVCAKQMGPTLFQSNFRNMVVFLIIGADRAITKSGAKWTRNPKSKKEGEPEVKMLCVGRPGITQSAKEQYERDLKNGLVPNSSSFIFAPIETRNVSSTLVRQKLKLIHQESNPETKLQIMNKELIESNLITREVGDYLLQHEKTLYL